MSEKPLSFKERVALRAKQAEQPPTQTLPAEEPKSLAPKRFGQPKTEQTTNAQNPISTGNEPAVGSESKPASKFGGGFKKSIQVEAQQAIQQGPVEEAPSPKQEEAKPLPHVIKSYNTVGGAASTPTEGELLSGHSGDEAVRRIQDKIKDLSLADNQTDLRMEMSKLSEMLVANPAACLYLMDEDLGLAVRALRQLTNNRVAVDMAAAKPSKATREKAITAKPLSVEEMQNAFDDL